MTISAPQQIIAAGEPRPPRGTLNQLFFDAIERYDKPDAMLVKVDGVYKPISHRTLAERVRRVALGLSALGVKRGERVCILSETRAEWAIVDYGCLTAGIIDVPLYPTLPPEQMGYVIRDAAAAAIFVSTEEQAAKVSRVRGELPSLRHVIAFGDTAWNGTNLSLVQLEAMGAAAESGGGVARHRAEALRVGPDDIATIIYTSGTTGEPKGAVLTHDNLNSNVHAVIGVIPWQGDDVSLSFLPLSHVFERVIGHFLMMAAGVSVAYAESMESVAANLSEVKPTIAVAVPRVYEKIYARVLENAIAGSGLKKRIFFWARGVADRWADARLAGREPHGTLAVQYALAQRLVFSKLKARVGGRMRYFVSGGAPLAPEINKFFYAAGLTILEGYGLTETSPVICCNTPEHFRIGTVGRPVRGVEVTIAPDGEILTRGPHIMRGYYNKPQATSEAINAEGWFHTGDIGELRDGFLVITDRKKDLIVTAAGKNIAPQPIENQAKGNKYVSEAVLIGDKRKYPVLLVVPNFEHLENWARLQSLACSDRRQLLAHPAVKAHMEGEVLSRLTGLAPYEMPKKIGLLETPFSIESGELTPTLKVKRRVIDQRYKAFIDSLYAGDGTGVRERTGEGAGSRKLE